MTIGYRYVSGSRGLGGRVEQVLIQAEVGQIGRVLTQAEVDEEPAREGRGPLED